LTNLGTPAGTIDSVARGINHNGHVVGLAYSNSTNCTALSRVGSSWVVLPGLGGPYAQAQASNAAGKIVGDAALPGDTDRNAVMWHNGQITVLGRLPGTLRASGIDINDLDQVAGWSGYSYYDDGHAFLWENGVMTDLGNLGGSIARAVAINNSGHVTGASTIPSGQYHGFLYVDGVMYDVNNLLVPGTGWEILDAVEINASSQIAANGIIDGHIHACLLTPVPTTPDCNENGVSDDEDIASGDSLDCIPNGIPDECELISAECPYLLGDVDNDGEIDGNDVVLFALVLLNLNECDCSVMAADMNSDSVVDWRDYPLLRTVVRCNAGLPIVPPGRPGGAASLVDLAQELGAELNLEALLFEQAQQVQQVSPVGR
jgi:probable HAF family extracellular repeat protein